jgi:hypothetical protein
LDPIVAAILIARETETADATVYPSLLVDSVALQAIVLLILHVGAGDLRVRRVGNRWGNSARHRLGDQTRRETPIGLTSDRELLGPADLPVQRITGIQRVDHGLLEELLALVTPRSMGHSGSAAARDG